MLPTASITLQRLRWPFQRSRTWIAFSVVFTVPLWYELVQAVRADDHPAHKAVACLLIVAYLGCYTFGTGWAFNKSLAVRIAMSATAVMIMTVRLAYYSHWPWTFSYALAMIALLLPWAWAVGASGVIVGLLMFVEPLPYTTPYWDLMWLLLVVVTTATWAALWRSNQALEEANTTIADLAVHEDRQRLSRDLHDALGATLTTITVKASLVRRLLEDGSPTRALEEVRDVEVLGRRALGDVRAAVAANHTISMGMALSHARSALSAARISARLPQDTDCVPAVFAYVLREGVTNVVKHSQARTCQVRLGPTYIEIVDDGVGHTAHAAGSGYGLAGLAQRVEAVGGSLQAGPMAGGGFKLRAECPR